MVALPRDIWLTTLPNFLPPEHFFCSAKMRNTKKGSRRHPLTTPFLKKKGLSYFPFRSPLLREYETSYSLQSLQSSFFSSAYWDVSLRRVHFSICIEMITFYVIGFPHSEIPGSQVANHLPEAYRRHATSFIVSISQGILHLLVNFVLPNFTKQNK